MLKPLSDHVILEPVREEKKKGGIILPDTVQKEKSEKGKVIAVGPGKTDENGKKIPVEVKKGDIVLFAKYSAREIKVNDKEYLIVKQEDILAIIN
ncbi:MAG: co-chaperone GroES [Candidatus Sungbacteria bacterium RIFCSPLOWO2_02_FULL_54_10]|uniref:Co-chaperonin GroES n=2 Tax=Candidatus Yanofskyibacteriota TaxID=1752733 RepID=A0A1F8FUH5_9BACT|nr:MAG: 10 kDa chaperonin [Candidatus Yanofskybacteria bacterium GW2011_GWA1_41_6]OGN16641.1 MAG: co-chaperone GroES [Candidatus Yanofskybacteria bacterium RIFCSPHIGHO2_02_FULL_50_12]OHA13636.1 MAG: co-chaperone GroES [Candidatus Sungbacteria bacterium RIFCSPLOWO2_02_FULL_54_10]